MVVADGILSSQEDIANHFSILSLPEIGECSKVQEERAWRLVILPSFLIND